ncbi:hypothetical protein B0T20DRAFT_116115 [Sordaria brevicollis]|uniref:Secreted protein n=1 Tax=Sordaria brevicollis TaxID=83679 RepID=A0AAE0PKF1_SORBR|nr:hypothetical protein B0T20DRAFT_116115 [Sordaria brevicollis]
MMMMMMIPLHFFLLVCFSWRIGGDVVGNMYTWVTTAFSLRRMDRWMDGLWRLALQRLRCPSQLSRETVFKLSIMTTDNNEHIQIRLSSLRTL